MAQIQHDKQDHAHVGDEEALGIPGNEGCEALCEDDENVEEQAVPCKPWLPQCLVWEGIARDVANGQRAHEGNVTTIDTSPGDEASNSSDVEEPVEDGATVGGKIHECKKTPHGGECNGVVWDSLGAGDLEERWCGSVVGETGEDTRSRVNVGVSGGENNEEKDSIDQARKDLDTGKLSCDNEGRGGGIRSAGEKVLVGVRHQETNEEDAEDEEEENSVEGLADGRWDSFAWVLGLACCNTNKFGTLVRETSLDQDRPEADKLGQRTIRVEQVWSEGTWVTPGVEAEVAMLSRTGINADGEDQPAYHRDNFDGGQNKLRLTVEADGEEVDAGNDDPKDGDEDTDRESGVPVLDDQTGRSQFQRIGNSPREEIDPTHRKAQAGIDEASGVGRKCTRDRNVGCHFTERSHDRVDNGADKDVCDEGARGTRLGNRTTTTNEETRTNCATCIREILMSMLFNVSAPASRAFPPVKK